MKVAHSRQLIVLVALLLLGALFLLDLRTGRELVLAIAYTVPVALSSLARSPRSTLLVMGLALVATVGVGVENVFSEGLDGTALLNRGLATLSFVVVTVFVLMLERRGVRVSALEQGELRAAREANLRQLLTSLSHDDTPHALLTHAVTALQPLFDAGKVTISATRDGRLAAPHYSSTLMSGGELCPGRLLPWVAALPAAGTRTASARLDGKLLTAGWLHRPGKEALLVLVSCPTIDTPGALLSDVLEGLEPLLEHAERLEAQAWSPQPVLN